MKKVVRKTVKNSEASDIALLAIVGHNPCLYDKSVQALYTKAGIQDAWVQVSDMLNRQNKFVEDPENRFNQLRTYFVRHYREGNFGWKYFDKMTFLIGHFKSTSNFTGNENIPTSSRTLAPATPYIQQAQRRQGPSFLMPSASMIANGCAAPNGFAVSNVFAVPNNFTLPSNFQLLSNNFGETSSTAEVQGNDYTTTVKVDTGPSASNFAASPQTSLVQKEEAKYERLEFADEVIEVSDNDDDLPDDYNLQNAFVDNSLNNDFLMTNNDPPFNFGNHQSVSVNNSVRNNIHMSFDDSSANNDDFQSVSSNDPASPEIQLTMLKDVNAFFSGIGEISETSKNKESLLQFSKENLTSQSNIKQSSIADTSRLNEGAHLKSFSERSANEELLCLDKIQENNVGDYFRNFSNLECSNFSVTNQRFPLLKNPEVDALLQYPMIEIPMQINSIPNSLPPVSRINVPLKKPFSENTANGRFPRVAEISHENETHGKSKGKSRSRMPPEDDFAKKRRNKLQAANNKIEEAVVQSASDFRTLTNNLKDYMKMKTDMMQRQMQEQKSQRETPLVAADVLFNTIRNNFLKLSADEQEKLFPVMLTIMEDHTVLRSGSLNN